MSEPVDLYYEVHGHGEPVLCAGGWGVRAAVDLARLVPEIARDRTLITFHYRGIGNSPDGPPAHPSTRLYADDLRRLLDRLSVERTHLLGMGGMGACTLMELACLVPDRIGAAVLHEPWAVADTSLRWQLEALRSARRDSFAAYQRLAAVLCFTGRYIEEHADQIQASMWVNLLDRETAHLNFIQACLEHDARPRLPQLTVPCLLITGDGADIMTGDRLIGPLAALIAQSETHVMRGSPHAFFESDALVHEFDTTVAGYLERHRLDPPRSGFPALAVVEPANRS